MQDGNITLENEHGRVVVSPGAGASLRSLRLCAEGVWHELLSGGDGPHDPHMLPSGTGSFIMAPWPNRIRDGELFLGGGRRRQLPINSGRHAIHGTVRGREWQVVEASGTRAKLEVDLREPWPFPGTVTYEASLEGPSLRQTLTVAVSGGGPGFPAGFGWHPWFRRNLGGGDVRIHVPGQETVWELLADRSATGRTFDPEGPTDLRLPVTPDVRSLDHCFRITPCTPVTLEWPEGVRLQMVSAPQVSHLQVYTPEGAICVEPQSSTVDAFRLSEEGVDGTGAARAEPGAPFTGWTEWSWV